MGLYDRDYMREARTEAEARGEPPAWLRSAPARACSRSRGVWAVLLSLALWAANRHWHLIVFHLPR